MINIKVLIVEGKDEFNFISYLLDTNKYSFSKFNDETKKSIIDKKTGEILDEIILIDAKGRNNITKIIKSVTKFFLPEISIKILGIILDKEDKEYCDVFQSILKALKDNNYPEPHTYGVLSEETNGLKAGVFIMPGYDSSKTIITGKMLEDLILTTLPENEIFLTNDYIEKMGNNPKNLSKSKIQIYLGAQTKLTSSLGNAAQKKIWKLNHSNFDVLKDFLNNFYNNKSV